MNDVIGVVVWLVCNEAAHLNLGTEYDVCVTGVGQPKYTTKLIHGEVANVTDLELGRLGELVS